MENTVSFPLDYSESGEVLGIFIFLRPDQIPAVNLSGVGIEVEIQDGGKKLILNDDSKKAHMEERVSNSRSALSSGTTETNSKEHPGVSSGVD